MKVSRLFLSQIACVCALIPAFITGLNAQHYPSRPITIIVAYPPGGSADTLTRVIGQEMSLTIGQPVLIENKTGAGGNIGVAYAAKAQPDGYTILSSAIS